MLFNMGVVRRMHACSSVHSSRVHARSCTGPIMPLAGGHRHFWPEQDASCFGSLTWGQSEIHVPVYEAQAQAHLELTLRCAGDAAAQVGETLRDAASPPAEPNLRSALGARMVVYDIAPDGATRLPPLYVAATDGSQRPLNEAEEVREGGALGWARAECGTWVLACCWLAASLVFFRLSACMLV